MKPRLLTTVAGICALLMVGFALGRISQQPEARFIHEPPSASEWVPKVGDTVVARYHADGSTGRFLTVLTRVESVGSRSQTGLLVWGIGLPGVDSAWVNPYSGQPETDMLLTESPNATDSATEAKR